ncbi:hypothetical protein NL676_005844 [Syzygium grande]|nr:hypothetical protein NL676_005844 [Syzygium grande]
MVGPGTFEGGGGGGWGREKTKMPLPPLHPPRPKFWKNDLNPSILLLFASIWYYRTSGDRWMGGSLHLPSSGTPGRQMEAWTMRPCVEKPRASDFDLGLARIFICELDV